MTIWLHTSNAIKINNRSYFLLLEGFRKKKNVAKKSLIPDKKKSYSRHPKISWWNSAIFLHVFFCAKHASRGVKKKEKKHVKNASFGLE